MPENIDSEASAASGADDEELVKIYAPGEPGERFWAKSLGDDLYEVRNSRPGTSTS